MKTWKDPSGIFWYSGYYSTYKHSLKYLRAMDLVKRNGICWKKNHSLKYIVLLQQPYSYVNTQKKETNKQKKLALFL